MQAIIRALKWVGLIRIGSDGSVRWPFHVSPWWIWKLHAKRPWKYIGFFRNAPGYVKWEPGRILPARWGVCFIGIEFGDRG